MTTDPFAAFHAAMETRHAAATAIAATFRDVGEAAKAIGADIPSSLAVVAAVLGDVIEASRHMAALFYGEPPIRSDQ
jgi:hypothetical protein